MPADSRFASRRHPIFVLGILQRSGTNYLNNLLLLHPDVQPPGMIWEDFHVAHADLLLRYVQDTVQHWPKPWVAKLEADLGKGALLRHLGAGLIAFMEGQNRIWSERNPQPASPNPVSLISATPSVANLHLFFDLFPEAAPVIVIRDGPSLIESGVRSFGWDYEEAMRMWARSARRIIDFRDAPDNHGRFFLVRFDDLYTRNRDLMAEILDFLELDRSRYDFERAENLAVMGSSEVAQREGKVHWKAEKKRADFNPLQRASAWGPKLKSRFAWIARKESEALGYPLEGASPMPMLNTLLDWLYGAELKLKRVFPALATPLRRLRTRLLDAPTQPARK